MNKQESNKNLSEKYVWHFIDAKDIVLGRLASKVSKIILGKQDISSAPNIVSKNKVVITNTDKVAVTGKKLKDKVYFWHTGFPKGIRSTTLEEVMSKDSTKAVYNAIKGMMPKNKLTKFRMRNVFIYKDESHPHTAQSNAKNK